MISNSESVPIVFKATKIVCAGYSGRNQDLVKKHLEELRKLGIPVPSKIPVAYVLSPIILTNDEEIYVDKRETSGEVEAVLLFDKDDIYITVGSDHTDRIIEQTDIWSSKNSCPKVIAKQAWRVSDIEDHIDELKLVSYTSKDEMEIYQSGSLADIIELSTLIKILDVKGEGTVFFCGTIPTIRGEIKYSDYFLMKVIDPILRRIIMHGYQVKIMR